MNDEATAPLEAPRSTGPFSMYPPPQANGPVGGDHWVAKEGHEGRSDQGGGTGESGRRLTVALVPTVRKFVVLS